MKSSIAKSQSSLCNCLIDVAQTEKGITFVSSVHEEVFVSYSQLLEDAFKIGDFFQKAKIKIGDELLIYLPNQLEFVPVFWATQVSGVIAVPCGINYGLDDFVRFLNIWKQLENPYLITTKEEIESFKKNVDPDVLTAILEKTIFLDELLYFDNYADNPKREPNLKEQPVAFLQFTSGSTGDPKGVILTHQNIVANCQAMKRRLEINSEDKMLNWMPLTHDMGMILFHILSVVSGISQVLIPTNLFGKLPLIWMDKASEHQITLLGGPNYSYFHFLNKFNKTTIPNWDLSKIKGVINGAEPISVHLIKEFNQALRPLNLKPNTMLPTYGLAEASVVMTLTPPGAEVVTVTVNRNKLNVGDVVEFVANAREDTTELCCVGAVLDNAEFRIVDDQGQKLADNTVGHLEIRGDNVTSGYYGKDNKNQELITDDGWLKTGDVGFKHHQQLVICGREKDIIFVVGKNYYANDIENTIIEFGGINPNTVVACGLFDDALSRDLILVFVKYRGSLDNFLPIYTKIVNLVAERIYLHVDHVLPITQVPKTTSGKLQRNLLAKQFADGQFNDQLKEIKEKLAQARLAQIIAPTNEIEEVLLNIWEQVLEVAASKISITDHFMQIGGTSFKAMKMLFLLENALGKKLNEKILMECRTIKELSEKISLLI